VIATAGSPGKLDVCIRYGGADEALDYTKKDWPQKVMRITNGKGVGTLPLSLPGADRGLTMLLDVVYDPVGLIRGNFLSIRLQDVGVPTPLQTPSNALRGKDGQSWLASQGERLRRYSAVFPSMLLY
jgi:hypothetical protein